MDGGSYADGGYPGAYDGGEGYAGNGEGGFGGIFGNSCAHQSVWGWFETEALWWHQQGKRLPALVTTSDPGTIQTDAGVLGLDSTTVLLGNEQVGGGSSEGYRLTLGGWLDRGMEQALVVRYWSLKGDESFNEFTSDATGDPILARPFLNVGLDPDQQDALLIGFPGIAGPGFVRVRTSGNIYGGDLLFRSALDRGCGYRLDFVGGYQGTKINDNVSIRSFTTDQDPGNLIADGTTIDVNDAFGAVNEFHGGVLGLQGEFQRGPWLFRALTKLGVGSMHQRVNIAGSTTIDTGVGTSTTAGGLLAQPTNIGNFTRNEICFVPEINLTMSYQITCHIDINIGYSMIYYSSVANAADQIDLGVNLTNPGVDEPRPNLPGISDSDFWVQGVNLGFLVHW
jgi:hypothetical protein